MKQTVSFHSRVRLVPAQHKHIGRIARRMRAIDAAECRAFGREPKQALRAALLRSDKAWTALVDEQPEAMFGVVVENALTGEGVPWFLGTDEVYRHARELLMWGPGIIQRLGNSKLSLRNLVSAENDRAIRLLRKWGFVVHADEQPIGGEMFRLFEMEPA